MYKLLNQTLIIIILIAAFSSAQERNIGLDAGNIQAINSYNLNKGFGENIENDFQSALNTGLSFIKSPLHFSSEDFILTGIITGATSASLLFDQPVRNSVKKIHSSQLDRITPFGEDFGNPKYATALSGVLYLGGLLINEPELRKTGLILIETLIFNNLITEGLKMTIGRSRPYLNDGNMDMDFFKFEMAQEDYSMPSGHTSVAFSIATVLSQRIGNIYASAALYSLAGLTAFQRIYRDQHWISDTILAAAIGTVVGLKIVKLNSDNADSGQNSENSSVNVVPVFNHYSMGVGISAAF